MNLPVAILAGGLATRLHPLTQTIPKSLVSVAGDFFISHQLHYLHRQGITDVVLCLGHLGEQIVAVVRDGSEYGLRVRYAWDGLHPLGTGGAIKQALPLLGDAFFILYGDSYLPVNFAAVQQHFDATGKRALMTLFKNEDQRGKSNVLRHKNGTIVYNKQQPSPGMDYIDYGLSILSASLLNDFFAKGPFDLADFFHHLSLQGELFGYEVAEPFYEIGSWSGLQETRAFLLP